MDKILKAARASGSLDLSNRSLQELPKNIYDFLETVGKDEKWWEVVELQKLVLAHNKITILSEDLGKLSSLVLLNISHNQLTVLPAALERLTSLKSLDISGNQIAQLPSGIGNVAALVKLQCAGNLLTDLPSSIGYCSNLLELKVAHNRLTKLPQELGNCARLLILDIEGNQITNFPKNLLSSLCSLTELNAAKNNLAEVPGELGQLSKLVRLNLHQNRITLVPASLAGCSALIELSLGNNLISNLPSEIGALKSLSTLDLNTNKLTTFPVDACALQLSVLDLSNNSLTGLPPELGTMITLRRLIVLGNPLRSLRSSLVGSTPALLKHLRSKLPVESEKPTSAASGNIFGMNMQNQVSVASREASSSKVLTLVGKQLEDVPAAIWEAGDIIEVNLSRNLIEQLPTEMAMCITLEVLRLENNKIHEWPLQVLQSLPKLHELVLAWNPIVELPKGAFLAVPHLKKLDLSGIAVSLPAPPAFSSMLNLQELRLKRTRLQMIPPDLTSLTTMRILDLSENSISVIPEEICHLTRLEELDLSDNNISTLPPQLGNLDPCLSNLKLSGNPLRSIRRPVLERGTKAVLQYLKDKLASPP